jgi:uncharacterized protein
MFTAKEIDRLIRRIVSVMHPEQVIVFGSYAKGTSTIRSDLDIFVVQETDLPFARRADDLKPMLAQMLIPVDVHVYTPEEVAELGKEPWSFVNSILRTGKTLFSNGQFIRSQPRCGQGD